MKAGQFLELPFMSQIMPSEPESGSNRAEDIAALEADARLREDIRLLGRMLGDTVRDQEGAEVFDIVERIRQTSVRFQRDEDRVARREVLTLWQTNLLRRTKLTVLDEVANGLSFYDYTFLREVPRLHCALEDRLQADAAQDAREELASFLKMGSWIGGDRDGNPFVTSDVMRGTLRLQSSRIVRLYLEELHALGAELSIAGHLAEVSAELRSLAERSRDPSPHRSGEPYRLAVSGIYARLAATAPKLEVATSRPPGP